MSNKEANWRKLWEHFAAIKKDYDSHSLLFEMPETDIQELLSTFDSLDEVHKKDIAGLYDQTPDEFRKGIEQGWKELFEDNKHPYANQYERYFYQVIDPIIENLREAAKNLDLEIADSFIIALLPTREINAVAIKAPDNLGYIIAVNYWMMTFLNDIGHLFNRFYAKLKDRLKNPPVQIEGDLVEKYIQESIPDAIDERTNRLFVDVLLSFLKFPGFTGFSPQQALYDIDEGRLNDNFTKLVIPFILCHEYAHFCVRAEDVDDFLTRYYESLDPSERKDVAYKLSTEFVEEIMADKIGFDLLIEVALIHYGMPEENSQSLIAALGRAYSGMNSFFSCSEVLEQANLVLYGKGHDENDPHLPAQTRRESLARRTLGELREKGYPISSITLHGRIFESFINILWENNKDKIREVFLHGRERLD